MLTWVVVAFSQMNPGIIRLLRTFFGVLRGSIKEQLILKPIVLQRAPMLPRKLGTIHQLIYPDSQSTRWFGLLYDMNQQVFESIVTS